MRALIMTWASYHRLPCHISFIVSGWWSPFRAASPQAEKNGLKHNDCISPTNKAIMKSVGGKKGNTVETISDIYSCNLSQSVRSRWGHNEKYSFNLRSISHFVLGRCVRREELSYDQENIMLDRRGFKLCKCVLRVVLSRHRDKNNKNVSKVVIKLKGRYKEPHKSKHKQSK